MKKTMFMLLLLVAVGLLSACGKQEDNSLQKVLDAGKIVIATSPDYPPFEFIDASKSGQAQYVGSDIELMKFIASELGVTLEIQAVSFETVLSLTKDKAVDLAIAGFTYAKDREEHYIFSEYYHDEGSQGILVLASKYDATEPFSNFSSKKVGAQSATLQSTFVSEQISEQALQKFNKIADGIMLLDNGAVEGVALAEKVAEMIMQQNSGKYVFLNQRFAVDITESRVYALLPKGSNKLAEKINEIIEKVIDQGLFIQWDQDAKDLAIELGEMGS